MQITRPKEHQILHHRNRALGIRVQRPLLKDPSGVFVQRNEAAGAHITLPGGVRARFPHQRDIVDDGWRNQGFAVVGDWRLPCYRADCQTKGAEGTVRDCGAILEAEGDPERVGGCVVDGLVI